MFASNNGLKVEYVNGREKKKLTPTKTLKKNSNKMKKKQGKKNSKDRRKKLENNKLKKQKLKKEQRGTIIYQGIKRKLKENKHYNKGADQNMLFFSLMFHLTKTIIHSRDSTEINTTKNLHEHQNLIQSNNITIIKLHYLRTAQNFKKLELQQISTKTIKKKIIKRILKEKKKMRSSTK